MVFGKRRELWSNSDVYILVCDIVVKSALWKHSPLDVLENTVSVVT